MHKNKILQSGRSMVEMLGTIAIMAFYPLAVLRVIIMA